MNKGCVICLLLFDCTGFVTDTGRIGLEGADLCGLRLPSLSLVLLLGGVGGRVIDSKPNKETNKNKYIKLKQ